MTFDLILKGGAVVEPHQVTLCDIAVKDGKIVQISSEIMSDGVSTVELEGKIVLPGAIDAHVHFNEPGNVEWEGIETGSRMLAAGGATLYFDMPLNSNPPTIDVPALELKEQLSAEKSVIDYRFWGGLVPENISELESLSERGVIGFKAFISNSGFEPFKCVDNLALLNGMKEISRLGKILALHAESDEMTHHLASQKIAGGQLEPKDYCESRPIIAEVEAVQRAIAYAEITGCALHFVHISSPDAVRVINEAKMRGLNVTLETCSHYLLFNDGAFKEHGVYAKCAPPLRAPSIQQEMIELVADGKIDFVTSDHSPCSPELKDLSNRTFFEAWGGINGGQFTLLAVLEVAKEKGLPLTEVAKLTAEAPAVRFGIECKGRIEVGYDADFAIVEEVPFLVTKDAILARHKDSLYENHQFPYQIAATYCKGQKVFARNEGLSHI
ncbi:allantoinase AllB [Lysinibacillus sp. SGAir0095]|uniref:allantoinase AllB n=1 Tax=Lysinibacillus sp. SGAir0095 TaxID=2070463 RepID=UPI0010CD6008|nr:allantoinase AllB [Lysinibacillus sp. SGAir0095]QCR30987.1 allantoinase AllB [Lysinibacillus sp. SGAir0095]